MKCENIPYLDLGMLLESGEMSGEMLGMSNFHNTGI